MRGLAVPRISLNRTEVAASIGVSPNTVDQLVRDGLLPKPRRWHTRKLWITSEIAAYMSDWPVDGETGEATTPLAHEEWRASV